MTEERQIDTESILEKVNRVKDYQKQRKMYDYRLRKECLRKLYNNILAMKDEIMQALKQDLNKSEVESYMSEIGLVLSEITYMLKHIRKFSKIKRVKTPLAQFHSKSFEIPCAYGSVLIISPWNYPFMLAVEPIVDAVAAGNSVILKPSEISPYTSQVVEKLLNATFEKGHVEVVQGEKEECTFLLEQDFDYIFFTGSTRV